MERKFRIPVTLVAFFVLVWGCSRQEDGVDVPTGTDGSHASDERSLASVSEEINVLIEDYYEEYLKLNPLWASFIGDYRYNDRLTIVISSEYREKSRSLYERYRQKLREVDTTGLTSKDLLTYEVFTAELQNRIEKLDYPSHLLPITQGFSMHNGFAALGSGNSAHPFRTVKDYDDFLSRMSDFNRWVDIAISNMKEGQRSGVIQPRIVIEKVLPQLQAHLVDSVEDSVFYQPILNMPSSISETDRVRLTKSFGIAINETVIPAYKRLHDYLSGEYLPHTRTSVGLFALPNGLEWYDFLVRDQTTTLQTSEEIHQVGLAEVARITQEMRRVRESVNFEGSFSEFMSMMKSDPRFYLESGDELLETYRSLRSQVNLAVPGLFSLMPKTEMEIRPVPEYEEISAAAAYYYSGLPDGSRPGIFYVNTYDVESRPLYEVEATYLHEAVPGHHFEISLSRENASLPRIRREAFFGAYAEGWALYAESLGKDLGLYQDPYSYFGALSSEMLRAVRLVVDTGLHAKGWSRDQALDYMRENYPGSDSDIVAEIDRYIADPGQALSYKIGQLKIKELRERSENILGDDFDIREFHAVILKDGPLPMGVLEEKVNKWIDGRRRN